MLIFHLFLLFQLFFAFGAYGIFVLLPISISSTDTRGGTSIGCFAINGKANTLITIINAWKPVDNIILELW